MASVTTVMPLPPPKIHYPETTYTFASLPRALVLQRKKLRDYSKADESIQRQSGGGLYDQGRVAGRFGKTVPWAGWNSVGRIGNAINIFYDKLYERKNWFIPVSTEDY